MTAQDLKNAILHLAVQGKLVPQNPNDEPASELLKRINAEKERLVKEGKNQERKKYPEITEEDAPFVIPASWKWIRLGDFCAVYNGDSINANVKHEKYSKPCNGWDFIATKDVGFDHVINYQNGIRIPFQEADFKVAPAGSILLCMEGGSSGKKIGILDRDVCFGNKLCCFTPITVHNTYLYYYLQCPQFFSDFMGSMTGLIGGVGAAKLKNIAISIPPLTEQKRIVAKIEELMSLVEKYGNAEERLTALNAEFPDKLRKSILQQAIQGKLTERDPADEPASELLKRIRAEKGRLIKEGKIKKEKPFPPITEEEYPFEIPDGWKWIRFSDIATFENGDRSSRYPVEQDYVEYGIPFFGAKDMSEKYMSFANVRYISQKKFEELGNGKLQDKDFVCLLRGSVGKCAVFCSDNNHKTGFICAQMIIIRLIDKTLCDYIYDYLSSPYYAKWIESKVTGTAVKQLPGKELGQILIPLPPFAEQQRIVDRVNELLAVCDELK